MSEGDSPGGKVRQPPGSEQVGQDGAVNRLEDVEQVLAVVASEVPAALRSHIDRSRSEVLFVLARITADR